MDLDADATVEKAGFGLYCCFAAAVAITMVSLAVEMVLGFGLFYCFAAAVATEITS